MAKKSVAQRARTVSNAAPVRRVRNRREFAFALRDDSMVHPNGLQPGFSQRELEAWSKIPTSFPIPRRGSCIIVADLNLRAKEGGYVIAWLPGATEPLFRQLISIGAKQYLKPLNTKYPITPMPKDAEVAAVFRAQFCWDVDREERQAA